MGRVKDWGMELQLRAEWVEGWAAAQAGQLPHPPHGYSGDAREAWLLGHSDCAFEHQLEPQL